MTMHSVGDELHAILHSLASGARYGFRIRLPHALVMTLLFKPHVPARAKVQNVLQVAAEHAGNLAAFAAVYKSILALLKWTHRHFLVSQQREADIKNVTQRFFHWIGRMLLTAIVDGPLIPGIEPALVRATDHSHDTTGDGHSPPGHPERSHHALLAGAVGGYLIWGRYSAVNNQIVLYVTSRVLASLCTRHLHRRLPESVRKRGYALAAATVWALVMLLFEEDPDVLHPSLRSSMEEIYRIRGSTVKQRSSQSSGNESAET